MIDQKTPNLQMPLPHPANALEDDVLRLRDALNQVDGLIFTMHELLASNDVNLDTVQEIVTVLKDAQGDIGDITAVLASKATAAAMNAVAADLATTQASLQTTIGKLNTLDNEMPTALAGKASLGANNFTGSQNFKRGTPIASAATIDLNNTDGNTVHITGSNPISAVQLADGAERTAIFDGAPKLMHGADLRCPGDADLQVRAGQTIKFVGDADGVVRVVSGGTSGLSRARQYFYMQS